MNRRPNRHWLRFRLRTLFVIMTVAALALGWEWSVVRSRRAALVAWRANPAALVIPGALMPSRPTRTRIEAWRAKLRELMGDELIAIIRFDVGVPASEIKLAGRLFPEADVSERTPDMPVAVPPASESLPNNVTPRN